MNQPSRPDECGPQNVGEALAILMDFIPQRIRQTQFTGRMWDDFVGVSACPLDGALHGHPLRLFLAQYLVNLVCQNLMAELSMQQVCIFSEDGVHLRPITSSDVTEISSTVQHICAFVQKDLGIAVTKQDGMPFVRP